MKIKILPAIILTLCLVFSLCACGNEAKTDETTTAPAATTAASTEADTAAPVATETETTAAPTETAADTTVAAFTEDDALELVKNSYSFDDEYFFHTRGTVEIDGVSYYAVDLMKSLESNTTYLSSYFVTVDGSEIVEGYFENDTPVISNTDVTLNITEDNAVKAVEAAYDFEDNCYLTYRGVEEIDGTSYYAVDLRKNLDDHSTYLSSYFVKADGTIISGYYENNTPVLAE